MILAQYNFNNPTYYTVSDGIPSNTIYSITQDVNGYIWMGSEGGICSFDGSNFKVFGEQNDLLPHIVTKTEFDNEQRLWINTFGPLRYIEDLQVKEFTGIKSPDLNWSYGLTHTDDDLLWLAMTNEIGVFNGKNLETHPFPHPKMQNSEFVKLILGSWGDTVYIHEEPFVYSMNGNEIIDSFHIQSIGEENYHNQVMWDFKFPNVFFNSKEGIVVYNFETRLEKTIDSSLTRSRDVIYLDNKLYLTDIEKGIWILHLDDEHNLQEKQKVLPEDFINQIYIDDRKNLWFTTYGKGLVFLPQEKKKIAHQIKIDNENHSQDFYSVQHDDAGTIWAGSFEGILTKITDKEQTDFSVQNKYNNALNRFLDIQIIAPDSVLIASDEYLLFFDRNTFNPLVKGSFKAIEQVGDSLISTSSSYSGVSAMEDLFELKKPLSILKAKEKLFKTIDPGRSYAASFKDGYYWIANAKQGLRSNDPNFKSLKSNKILEKIKANITDLCFKDDLLIMTTNGQGVFILKGNELAKINKLNGLSSNLCNAVEVSDDRIYIATNTGLNILKIIDWDIKSFEIEIIDEEDGLISNEVSDLSIFDDEIICATRKGLSRILKNEVRKSDIDLPVLISEVKCNNIQLPIDSTYILAPDENNIQIKFNVIDFENKKKTVFAYRMLGEHSDWLMTTSNEKDYNNLPPGEYEFQLGVFSPQSQDISLKQKFNFEIEVPFVDSLLFKYLVAVLLLFLLILGLIYYSDQVQKEKLRTLVDSKTLEIEEKLSELSETNEKLEESNKELKSFAYVTSHDLKSPLRNIHAFVELLRRKNSENFDAEDEEYMSIILNGTKRMRNIIDDLLMLSKLKNEAVAVDVDLNLILENVLKSIGYFGPTESLNIIKKKSLPVVKFSELKATQLIQNLIENGIKYNLSEQKQIVVDTEETEDFWILKIMDNGIGIDPKHQTSIFEIFKRLHAEDKYSGTGIGLAICKRIIESQKGSLLVESELGKGSTFIVKIRKKIKKRDL